MKFLVNFGIEESLGDVKVFNFNVTSYCNGDCHLDGHGQGGRHIALCTLFEVGQASLRERSKLHCVPPMMEQVHRL